MRMQLFTLNKILLQNVGFQNNRFYAVFNVKIKFWIKEQQKLSRRKHLKPPPAMLGCANIKVNIKNRVLHPVKLEMKSFLIPDQRDSIISTMYAISSWVLICISRFAGYNLWCEWLWMHFFRMMQYCSSALFWCLFSISTHS